VTGTTTPLGMQVLQASIFGACPKPSGVKMGDDGGGSLISPNGVVPSRMVGVSASVIFPCTIKSRRNVHFFWHQLTRVFPEKGREAVVCMCACVRA